MGDKNNKRTQTSTFQDKTTQQIQTSSVLAKEEDGTIQLTITIPKEVVEETEIEVLQELAKTTNIPGFRAGHAPVEEVKKRVASQKVFEGILGKILPEAYQKAVRNHNLKPILSPKFELVQAATDKDWQVRAISCEAPTIDVGDFKNELEGTKRTKVLWIPGQDKKRGQYSQEEKEQLVIETLLKTSQAKIPKVLVDEEVNHRLASLLEQTQKLGLTIEQYLEKTGKTAQNLREEYQKQAQDQIKTMLVLSFVADKEGIKVEDSEVEEMVKNMQSKNQSSEGNLDLQKTLIRGILTRRKALDRLVALL